MTALPERNSCCSWCGSRFPAAAPWPRTCAACGKTSFLNPLPVAVLLLPVDGGVLVVRRGISPGKGKLALPGGFIDVGETWQEAAARELYEETGVRIDAADVREIRASSAREGMLIVFGEGPPRAERDLPLFEPTGEATERAVLRAPRELAFPLHTDVVREWFERHAGRCGGASGGRPDPTLRCGQRRAGPRRRGSAPGR